MQRKPPDLSDLIGVPFVDLGRDPRTGLDCWGLALEVLRRMGIIVPDYSVPSCHDALAAADVVRRETGLGKGWEREEEPEIGDVVCMATDPDYPALVTHAGVYIGAGKLIHAAAKHNVSILRIRHIGLFGRFMGYYRWRG